METNTITALEIFEQGLTKSSIKLMANEAVNNVLETGNILQVAEAVKAMEEFIEGIKKDKRFVDYVREEAGKDRQYTSSSGAKIECCEVGTKYDFSKCGDPVLFDLEMQSETLKEKIKARQDMLKTLPLEGIETVICDELVRMYPPAKSSTSSYKITLSK